MEVLSNCFYFWSKDRSLCYEANCCLFSFVLVNFVVCGFAAVASVVVCKAI